jgi:phospholipid transport system substrate-binding protein
MVAFQAGVLFLLSAVEPRGDHATSAPLAEIKRSTEALRKVLAKRPPSWSPEAEARASVVEKIIDSIADFDEIARRTLGGHWDDLTTAQQEEFSTTLHRLIEHRSQDLRRLAPETAVVFDGESIDGDEATVTTTVTIPRGDSEVRREVHYRMTHRQGRWRLYDVVIDGTSMVDNYRSQFAHIIASESVDGLLRRMRKKLAAEAR